MTSDELRIALKDIERDPLLFSVADVIQRLIDLVSEAADALESAETEIDTLERRAAKLEPDALPDDE